MIIDSLPLAGINALGTILALFYIDKLGRRYILLRIVPFISISLFILSIGLGLKNYEASSDSLGKWVSLSGMILYLAFFSVSMGSTPWTVNSEIYPLPVRGLGISLATTVNWVSNYIVS